MKRIWINKATGDTRLVACFDNTIYIGYPEKESLENIASDFNMGIPPDHIFHLPLSYIHEINSQEGKNSINVLYRENSNEQINISDHKVKEEIFGYIRQNIPNVYVVERYGRMRAIRRPFIALCIVALVFAWTLFIAYGIESGSTYDVTEQKYHSVAGIVLLLASLGVMKVIMIFAPLMLIALYSMWNKGKNPPVMHRLLVKH